MAATKEILKEQLKELIERAEQIIDGNTFLSHEALGKKFKIKDPQESEILIIFTMAYSEIRKNSITVSYDLEKPKKDVSRDLEALEKKVQKLIKTAQDMLDKEIRFTTETIESNLGNKDMVEKTCLYMIASLLKREKQNSVSKEDAELEVFNTVIVAKPPTTTPEKRRFSQP